MNCYGNDSVVTLARAYPKQFVYFANELPDISRDQDRHRKIPEARSERNRRTEFPVECDSPAMQLVAEIARAHRVPVLMHFQHNTYNMGIERFHKMLAKYPTVNFIGHAQTFWGNIDKAHSRKCCIPKVR